MIIKELAKATGAYLIGDDSIPVTDVTHDSRQAKEASLFVAIRGELFDAHKFIPQVIQQGAVGVISELEPPADWRLLSESRSATTGLAPAWLKVKDVRRAMALVAA